MKTKSSTSATSDNQLLTISTGLLSDRNLLRHLIDTIPDIVYIHDVTNRKPALWNQAFEQLTGFSEDEILAKATGKDWLIKQDLPIIPHITETISRKEQQLFTLTITDANHQPLPLECSITPIKHPDGRTMMLVIGRSLRQRKELESQLRKQMHLVELVANASQTFFAYIHFPDYSYRILSPTYLNTLGLDPKELDYNDLQATLGFRNYKLILPYLKQVTYGEKVVLEAPFKTRIGERWFRVTLLPDTDETGHVIGAIVNATDIHETKKAEQRLNHQAYIQQTLATLGQSILNSRDERSIFEFAMQAIMKCFSVDQAYLTQIQLERNLATVRFATSANKESKEKITFTLKPDELNGFIIQYNKSLLVENLSEETRITSIFSPFQSDPLSAAGVIIPGLNQPYGTLVLTATAPNALLSEDMHILQSIANLIGSGLTQLRLYQDLEQHAHTLTDKLTLRTVQLQRLENRLATAEKLALLGKFAGNVAHEIRNPLATIKNVAYLLKHKLQDASPQITQDLDILSFEINRMERVIAAIVNYTGERTPPLVEVSLPEVIQQSIEQVNVPDTVDLELNLDETTPHITGDADGLFFAFRNLIKNAIQAMPDGGKLSISLKPVSQKQVQITVKDTGIGISAKNISRIFDPLFTTRKDGFGIGLSLTQSIIEKHNGSIRVSSSEGVGTTFTINLPIK